MDARLKSLLVLGKEHYERREFDRAEQAFHEVLAAGDHFADVHNSPSSSTSAAISRGPSGISSALSRSTRATSRPT
jgi:hypothetical protein